MDDQRNNQDAETLYTGLPAIDDLPAIYRYLNEEKARYVIIGGMAFFMFCFMEIQLIWRNHWRKKQRRSISKSV